MNLDTAGNGKKLLGIVASYRQQGNGEIVAKAVGRELGGDWDLSLVRLPKLSIAPCKGCYVCLIPGKQCNIKDDVAWLFQRLDEADAVIFTAPNYILGPVGMVKMLTDRALQAAPYADSFNHTKTAVALTMGKEDYRGYADTVLASQVAGLGLDVRGVETFHCTHPGEAALAPNFQQKISALARCLENPETPTLETRLAEHPDRCPRCHSDLFRVRPQGLECAICKAEATLAHGKLTFTDFHPMFTDEGRREHLEWLLMKKKEFKEIKHQLQEIRDDYQDGCWLTPQ
jgi:NAD(P)H-dependent FMN reductase